MLFSIALLILLYGINKPFIGHHDWNGVFWGGVARNNLGAVYRFFGHPLGQTIDVVTGEKFLYNYHYPPLIPFLFVLSSFFFGLSEASMRLVSVGFSLLLIVYIYRIGALLYTKRVGLIAAAMTMVTPMFVYFGKLPDHEPILTSLCVMSFYYYLRQRRGVFFFLLILALLESWGAFFLLSILFFHTLITKPMHTNRWLLSCMVVIGAAVIGLHLASIWLLMGRDGIEAFIQHGILRMNMDTSDPMRPSLGMKEFVMTELRYMVIYFTKIMTIMSVIWLGRFFFRLRNKKSATDASLFLLFLFPVSYLSVFRNLAFIHDYKLYLLLPFVALSSAALMEIILNKAKEKITATVCALLLLVIGWERVSFLKTLQTTSFNTPGYMLGNYLSAKTEPEEKTFLLSKEFDDFYGIFARFYANRKIEAADINIDDLQKNAKKYKEYRYMVIIENRPIDAQLKEHLKKTYATEKKEEFSFVDMQKRL